MGVGLDTRRLRLDADFKRAAAWYAGFDLIGTLSMGIDLDTHRLRPDSNFKGATA